MTQDRPIFYFTRTLPAYRWPILEKLDERLLGRLVVCSGMPPEGSSMRSLFREQKHHFTHELLPNYWFRGERLHFQPFRRVFRKYGTPAVVLAEESPRSLSLPLLLAYARHRGSGTALWGHFSSNNRRFSPERHLQDRYRVWLARQADACACYTDGIARLLSPHVPQDQLFVATNTLDTSTLFALDEELEREGRAAVRRRLDLPPDAPVLVFIGRLIQDKGTRTLLDVYTEIRGRGEAALVVIGDGPDREAMEARVERERLDMVRFTGALTRWDDSAPYLFAGDVMVQPGYLGLSVNHAFAFGLPVVSQQAPGGVRYHSPEAEYVVHGDNGMLARHGDRDAMIEAVQYVLDHRERLSMGAREYGRRHLRVEQMIDGLEQAVEHARERSVE